MPREQINVPVQSLGQVLLFAIPWTVARKAPLSVGFPRKEYWSRLPFPSPGDLLSPGTKPTSPVSADKFITSEPDVADQS